MCAFILVMNTIGCIFREQHNEHDEMDRIGEEDGDEFSDERIFIWMRSEKVRHQIEINDPDLVRLEIGPPSYHPNDDDWRTLSDCNWEKDGKSIGKNTHIMELMIVGVYLSMTEDLEKFFRHVSHNRSIQKLIFTNEWD